MYAENPNNPVPADLRADVDQWFADAADGTHHRIVCNHTHDHRCLRVVFTDGQATERF